MHRPLLLAKTFFGRFFESDLMPPGLPQVQLVIWSMALLACPGLLLPTRFATKYLTLRVNRSALAHALLVDRLLFITLTMTAIGLVALVIWDGMFPDRRDARILTGLPLTGRVLIAARLLALAALGGLFLAGINLVPTLLYGTLIARYGGASNPLQGAMAHFLATTLAGIFVFAALIALQGLILNLRGRRAAERLSVLLQVLFVVALLQLIFFMPRVGAMLPADLRAPWLHAVPSLWFLGLYDVLGGRPVGGSASLAATAVLATVMSVVAAASLFISTHARLTRLALETRDAPRLGRRAALSALNSAARICPRPAARATFEFTLRTLARSRSHRLLLSIYVGVALALVGSAIVPLAIRGGLAAFATPGVEVLSAPLVIGFFTLVGIRVALAIPVEPRANWIFRLCEPANRVSAINGVRAALLVIGVLPTSLLAAVSAGALWGVGIGVAHASVCTLMGWMLIEILMIHLDKMPFTCTYFPGRSRVRTLWPLYLTGLITYCYTIGAAEILLFKRPGGLATLLLLIGSAIALLTFRRHRHVSALAGFRFQEEDPATLFTGFQLSEGFAAAPEETRRLR